jgi:hypothetical protein
MLLTAELQAFLAADDLDELLNARQQIASLGAQDTAVVRSVLGQWQNPQAVSNLLFHPGLIPEDLRVASLFRGLAERQVIYYVLASVVGFQSIDPAEVCPDNRGRIVEELLSVIRATRGILAQRASVSIQCFLSEEDAPRVLALWSHPDDTVWHNLRAWLFRTFQVRGVQSFAEAARRSGLAEAVQTRLAEELSELVNNPPNGFDSRLSELFGYIPNLRDMGQKAERSTAADRPRDSGSPSSKSPSA